MDVRGVIVDLDGTVYRGDDLLPGAREAVAALREAGLELLFCTNNPTRSAEAYAERLRGLGVPATSEEILPAGRVTVEFLSREHAGASVFLVGSDGLREQLNAADVDLIDAPEGAEVLVTSYDPAFDYDDLTAGLWALEDAGAFVGTDPDRTYPDAGGRHRPGSGAITGAVAHVAEREPDCELGKPAAITAELARELLGTPPGRTLVVGDTPGTDLRLGARTGMRTALVLTGTTDESDLPVEPAPDHVIDTLADLPALLGV